MSGGYLMLLRLLVILGLTLTAYGGYSWLTTTDPTPEQLAAAVALNYEIDNARRQDNGAEITATQAEKQRAALRAELFAELAQERDRARSWFIAGIAVLIFSLGRLFALPLRRRNP